MTAVTPGEEDGTGDTQDSAEAEDSGSKAEDAQAENDSSEDNASDQDSKPADQQQKLLRIREILLSLTRVRKLQTAANLQRLHQMRSLLESPPVKTAATEYISWKRAIPSLSSAGKCTGISLMWMPSAG